MFQDIPEYHLVCFPQRSVELDILNLTKEQLCWIKRDDLAKFYVCMKEIYDDGSYRDPKWTFFYIIRWCIQEEDLAKLNEISHMVHGGERTNIEGIIMYWAWEEQKYNIFAWGLYVYCDYDSDFVIMEPILLIKKKHWPERFRSIFETCLHDVDHIYLNDSMFFQEEQGKIDKIKKQILAEFPHIYKYCGL